MRWPRKQLARPTEGLLLPFMIGNISTELVETTGANLSRIAGVRAWLAKAPRNLRQRREFESACPDNDWHSRMGGSRILPREIHK